MRFIHHFLAALALLAAGIGGVSSAATADHDVHAAMAGRQKIREELSAALAKGYLTRMDQYHLLVHAKEVLCTEDLQGFERTLDRLATQQALARHAPAVVSGTTAAAAPEDGAPRVIATSRLEDQGEGGKVYGSGGTVEETAPNGPTIEQIPPGTGRPTMGTPYDDPDMCGCDGMECRPRRQWFALEGFTSVEGFKGPEDIGNANGNFGVRVGVNGAISVFQRWGIGLQAGMAADITNLKGSPYPDFDTAVSRDQYFATVGMFQRINRSEDTAFTWGFVYDFLQDNYYSDFHMGQWRVKAEYEADPFDAFGLQASIPEHGSTGQLPDLFTGGVDLFAFKPLAQGNVYWSHTFSNFATLTGRFGVAERPSNFVFGADGCVPVTQNLAMTGSFTYIMPNVGAGYPGQDEEVWNLMIGLEFVPGGFRHGSLGRLRPFLPVADNGSFATRLLP